MTPNLLRQIRRSNKRVWELRQGYLLHHSGPQIRSLGSHLLVINYVLLWTVIFLKLHFAKHDAFHVQNCGGWVARICHWDGRGENINEDECVQLSSNISVLGQHSLILPNTLEHQKCSANSGQCKLYQLEAVQSQMKPAFILWDQRHRRQLMVIGAVQLRQNVCTLNILISFVNRRTGVCSWPLTCPFCPFRCPVRWSTSPLSHFPVKSDCCFNIQFCSGRNKTWAVLSKSGTLFPFQLQLFYWFLNLITSHRWLAPLIKSNRDKNAITPFADFTMQ